jgi:hypothetical protein
MPEVEAKIRSRTQSPANDYRNNLNRWKPGEGESTAQPAATSADANGPPAAIGNGGGEGRGVGPIVSSEDEFKPKKKYSKQQHPAEQRKAVLMKMGSLEDKERSDAFKKNPRSMIRRFSRAASFKKAREYLTEEQKALPKTNPSLYFVQANGFRSLT